MKTIAKPFQTSIDIKKSQFICRLFPAQNENEAKEIIREISEKYRDATHNCTAYVVSDGEGYDDDGEPGGTAGRPMLNVLKKNEMENVVAIVTRYFGGDSEIRAKNLAVVEKQYEANVIYFVASNNVDMVKNIQDKLANEVKIEHLGSRFLEKIN